MPGARTCSVCGVPLAAAPVGTPSGTSGTTFPMLITTAGRKYRLMNHGETLLGSRGCAITLTEPGVVAQHARLVATGGGFTIEDLGGGVAVNGRPIHALHPLQPGDRITLGQASLEYQGPAAMQSPQPALPQPPPRQLTPYPPAQPPQVIPLPLPPMRLPTPPSGIQLLNWGKRPPLAEGEVALIDGPHMMDKGNAAGKLAAAAVLGLFTRGALAFLPFMGRQEIPVWFLRIRDLHTNQQVSVVMGGRPSALPQLGDVIAVWGQERDGNVIMEKGYSYATRSDITLRR